MALPDDCTDQLRTREHRTMVESGRQEPGIAAAVAADTAAVAADTAAEPAVDTAAEPAAAGTAAVADAAEWAAIVCSPDAPEWQV